MTQLNNTTKGQGDDSTTGCLLEFAYFEKKLQVNCCKSFLLVK